jgi:two-component sensor histidine kinase
LKNRIFTFFLFIFYFGFNSFSQEINTSKKIKEIDSLLYSHLGKIALPIIDSLLKTELDREQKHHLLANKMEAYIHIENYEAALPFSNELLKDSKLKGYPLIKVYIERALLYEVSAKYDKSKQCLDFVANHYKNPKNVKDELYGEYLYRLSSWYRINRNISKSIELAEEAVFFGQKNNYGNVEATGLLLLSITKYKNQLNKKEELYRKALSIWKKSNNHLHKVFMHQSIANSLLLKEKKQQAIKHLDSAIILSSKIEYYRSLASCYRVKSGIYEKEKKYRKALIEFKNYESASNRDALNQQKAEVSKIETKYNYKSKELENNILTKEITSEKESKIYFIITSGIFFVLLCLLGYLLFKISKNRKELKSKSEEIYLKNKNISLTLDKNEILFKELNHRVKNNLTLILSLIRFQYEKLDNTNNKNNFIVLENRIRTIALAHEQLIYNNHNMLNKNYDLENYISKIAEALIDVSTHKIQFNLSSSNINLNIDTFLPIGIMINELMSNSIKYAVFKDVLVIDITFKKEDNKILLNYKDSGLKFIESKNEYSLGITIIESMVRQLKGNLKREKSLYSIVVQIKN